MKKPFCSGLSLVLTILSATTLAGAQTGTESTASTSSSTVAPQAAAPSVASESPTADAGTGGASPIVDDGSNAVTAPGANLPAPTTATPGEPSATSEASAPVGDEQADDRSDKGKGKGKKKKKRKADKADKASEDDDHEMVGSDLGDSGDEAKKKLPWDTKTKISMGGLLHSQFAINDAPEAANYDFRLANARIYLEWRQGSLFDAQAEVELSRDGDRAATSWAPMRDAFVRASFDPAVRVRLGQFKRPYGRLSVTSLRELKLIRRGISDVWINEELSYGERDVGFQVDGKLGKGLELHYAFGVFNGNGRNHRDNDPNGTKDFVGRVEGWFGKHLSVGFNSSNKRFDPRADRNWIPPKSAWMSGADILFKYAGLYALVEGQYGSNYRSLNQYHTGSLLALVSYKLPITDWWQIAVEPLVKGEILKVETEVRNQQILNGTAGANLLVGDIFRLMVQGEWIEPKGLLPSNLTEARAEKRLIVQACMYTR